MLLLPSFHPAAPSAAAVSAARPGVARCSRRPAVASAGRGAGGRSLRAIVERLAAERARWAERVRADQAEKARRWAAELAALRGEAGDRGEEEAAAVRRDGEEKQRAWAAEMRRLRAQGQVPAPEPPGGGWRPAGFRERFRALERYVAQKHFEGVKRGPPVVRAESGPAGGSDAAPQTAAGGGEGRVFRADGTHTEETVVGVFTEAPEVVVVKTSEKARRAESESLDRKTRSAAGAKVDAAAEKEAVGRSEQSVTRASKEVSEKLKERKKPDKKRASSTSARSAAKDLEEVGRSAQRKARSTAEKTSGVSLRAPKDVVSEASQVVESTTRAAVKVAEASKTKPQVVNPVAQKSVTKVERAASKSVPRKGGDPVASTGGRERKESSVSTKRNGPEEIDYLVSSGRVKSLTVTKLRRLLTENGLTTKGKKAELVQRLVDFSNKAQRGVKTE